MEMDELFTYWAMLPLLTDAESAEVAKAAETILDFKKARNVSVICVEGRSDITDYLVLATATSSTHVKALAGELEFRMGQRGLAPLHADGGNARNWQVVDYGSVMVHIFDEEARAFYNLDKLYREAAPVADGNDTEGTTDEV